MSNYTELYKKYRPKDWDSIVGQGEVVDSLRKAVKSNNIPTAYLFAGKQHGCGKTTTAFVLAKALNCLNPDTETGNPCNECSVCKNIDAGKQIGVNYISMANRGSAQEVRKIVEQAQMAQPVNKQVWILDESHRMSKEAAESLLIPLESNNMKSLFIFCSTEPENIIPTVKSRLQLRSFTPISTRDIAIHLAKIAKLENFELTREQIMDAAVEGHGSLRDSLTNLEEIAAGKELTTTYKNKILNNVSRVNFVETLSISADMDRDGIDFKKTLEQLYRDFADMLLIASGVPMEDLANKAGYQKLAKMISIPGLTRGLDIIGNGLQSMSINATINNRIMFEITMNKLLQMLSKLREASR